MKEIPEAYVKTNQTGIVITVLLAIVFQLPWLLAVLFVIQLLGLSFGLRGNLFVAAAKPFLKVNKDKTQEAELTRFNNMLAVSFLAIFLLMWSLGWMTIAYVFAGLLATAAFAAVCGYCIGCTVYFQYKQIKARAR